MHRRLPEVHLSPTNLVALQNAWVPLGQFSPNCSLFLSHPIHLLIDSLLFSQVPEKGNFGREDQHNVLIWYICEEWNKHHFIKLWDQKAESTHIHYPCIHFQTINEIKGTVLNVANIWPKWLLHRYLQNTICNLQTFITKLASLLNEVDFNLFYTFAVILVKFSAPTSSNFCCAKYWS